MTVLSGKARCNLCQAMLKPKTWWFYWKWCWYNSALAAQYLHFILCFWGTNCFKSGRVWRQPVSTQYSNITDGLEAKPLHKTTNFICFHLNRPKGFQKMLYKTPQNVRIHPCRECIYFSLYIWAQTAQWWYAVCKVNMSAVRTFHNHFISDNDTSLTWMASSD